ncbi:MAG: D-alanyl-D-alanine carboxypeptidase [Alphaproteobacteria bacterium]|nr:D-alanyl-D-alanine carboxypeptidase [Alphaproteobacteria bacterium]
MQNDGWGITDPIIGTIFMGMVSLLGIICCFFMFVGHLQGATYSAVITELKTGNVLAQSDAHTPVYPASLTKLMTLYILFQSLEQGRIRMDTLFKVSPFAARQPPSKWGLKPGSRISVRQCILTLSVKSCNDVAHVVSENLFQSTRLFVQTMNATALKLGMLKTVFQNPSGWHHRFQKTTAHDMAILMRAICVNFPQYAGFLGVPSIQKGNHVVRNTNKLLGRVPGLYLGKTGYTSPSGYNLVTVTSRNNQPIVVVVMGMPSKIQRDQLMAALIETCYKAPHQLHLAIAKPLTTLSKTPHLAVAGLGQPCRTKYVKIRKIGKIGKKKSKRPTGLMLNRLGRKIGKKTTPVLCSRTILPQQSKKQKTVKASKTTKQSAWASNAMVRKTKGRDSRRKGRKRQSLVKRQTKPSSGIRSRPS